MITVTIVLLLPAEMALSSLPLHILVKMAALLLATSFPMGLQAI